MMLLQERACLSYKEARTYLRKERFETYEMLAGAFSTDVAEVISIEKRAMDKVEEAQKHCDLFLDYSPMPPENRKTFDCDVSDKPEYGEPRLF